MNFTAEFEKLGKNDANTAGGKGASLGEMTQAGIPVPPGFVVLSGAFEKFLEETDLNVEIDAIIHSVNHKEIHTVENASEKIQALILGADMPKIISEEIKKLFKKLNTKYVAVRSSATAEDSASAAWAGQLDSYLNTTEKSLLENVKRCWASLFTPRAIFYRFEKGLHKQKISVAVVVQKMVESESSGIAFSVHPVTQDRNQIIIEAGFGLGEAIVSGQITPDSYVIEKESRKIIDKNIQIQARGLYRVQKGGPSTSSGQANEWKNIPVEKGEKQVLPDKDILKLSEIILRIENHYGFPCDIEWAFEKGKFYIVQSRPITTLGDNTSIKTREVKERTNRLITELPKENNEKLIDMAKILDWKHWLERPYGPFIATLNFAGVDKKYFKEVGLPGFGYKANLYQFPDLFYSEKLAEINRGALKKFLAKRNIFNISEILVKTHNRNKKEIGLLVKNKKISPLKKLSIAREILRRYFPFLWIIMTLEEYYNKVIAVNIPKYIKGDIQKFIGDASVPVKLNEYGKMLKMLKSGKSVESVCEKFGWLKSRDGFTDFYSPQELEDIKENIKNEKRRKIKIPKQLKGLVSEIRQLTFFRTDRTDKYYEILGLTRPIFKEVADFTGIPFKELENYDSDSIFKENPRKINKPFNFLYINGEQFIQYNPIMSASVDLQGDVKGITAVKGVVRGKVKVVRHPSEVDKVNRGDILVSQMTLPSFISAMQKASAFVTDEGSITCHAAIVAREMKKPCIISTKNATKILKDGDMVEVDADRGVVRILKKIEDNNPTSKIILSKYQSREHSMFYAHVWNEANRDYFEQYVPGTNIKNMVFMLNRLGVLEVYYDLNELENIFNNIAEEIIKNPKILDKIISDFYQYWNDLFPYVSGKRKIKNFKELKEYYKNWVNWWAAMAYVFVIPDREKIPKKLRDKALKVREATQEYSDEGDRVFTDFIKIRYKKYSGMANLFIPDECFRIEELSHGDINNIKKRNAGCALVTVNGKSSFNLLKKAEEKLAESNFILGQPKEGAGDELMGSPASPGKVRGKIKMVLRKSDLDSVKAGDIMVTYATSPDYVPAMKKCSAIITDEGGVVCHAAIVSRELGLPCIVGTKIATQVLKDGDLVEVDANKGIVRILADSRVDTGLNLKDWEFEYQQRDAQPPLMSDLWFRALRDFLPEELKLKINLPDYIFTNSNKGYVKIEDKKKIVDGIKKAVKSRKYLNYILNRTMAVVKSFDAAADKISRRAAQKCSADELSRLWDEFEKKIMEVIPWYFIPWYLTEENIISDRVKIGLGRYKKEIEKITDFNNALGALLFPVKEVLFQKEQKDFYGLVKLISGVKSFEKSAKFKKAAKAYLKKYAWTKTFLLLPIEPMSEKELVKKVKGAKLGSFVNDYELQLGKKKENKKLLDKINTIIKKDKKLAVAVNDARELGWVLTASVEQSLFSGYKLLGFYKNISAVMGIPYKNWVYLTSEEIRESIKNGRVSNIIEINKRVHSYTAIMQGGEIHQFSGDISREKSDWIDNNVGAIDKNIKEFSGLPAYPGKVRGKAKIILSPRESKKLADGEILITSMTSPDYIPAMKKAAAIITNEGGLLAHAAIISREFGKPCIVGTKIATQVLKDGDMVEVDADKGVVRILK